MAFLIIAVFAVGVYVGWWWHSQVAIDECLDQGGRWHPYGICDHGQKASSISVFATMQSART
jgi:hypothetical protein